MTEKELYIAHYGVLSTIVAEREWELESAKQEQKKFADILKKYNMTNDELKEIYHREYEEVKGYKEREREYIKRKMEEGKLFKLDNMWVLPSSGDKRKAEE